MVLSVDEAVASAMGAVMTLHQATPGSESQAAANAWLIDFNLRYPEKLAVAKQILAHEKQRVQIQFFAAQLLESVAMGMSHEIRQEVLEICLSSPSDLPALINRRLMLIVSRIIVHALNDNPLLPDKILSRQTNLESSFFILQFFVEELEVVWETIISFDERILKVIHHARERLFHLVEQNHLSLRSCDALQSWTGSSLVAKTGANVYTIRVTLTDLLDHRLNLLERIVLALKNPTSPEFIPCVGIIRNCLELSVDEPLTVNYSEFISGLSIIVRDQLNNITMDEDLVNPFFNLLVTLCSRHLAELLRLGVLQDNDLLWFLVKGLEIERSLEPCLDFWETAPENLKQHMNISWQKSSFDDLFEQFTFAILGSMSLCLASDADSISSRIYDTFMLTCLSWPLSDTILISLNTLWESLKGISTEYTVASAAQLCSAVLESCENIDDDEIPYIGLWREILGALLVRGEELETELCYCSILHLINNMAKLFPADKTVVDCLMSFVCRCMQRFHSTSRTFRSASKTLCNIVYLIAPRFPEEVKHIRQLLVHVPSICTSPNILEALTVFSIHNSGDSLTLILDAGCSNIEEPLICLSQIVRALVDQQSSIYDVVVHHQPTWNVLEAAALSHDRESIDLMVEVLLRILTVFPSPPLALRMFKLAKVGFEHSISSSCLRFFNFLSRNTDLFEDQSLDSILRVDAHLDSDACEQYFKLCSDLCYRHFHVFEHDSLLRLVFTNAVNCFRDSLTNQKTRGAINNFIIGVVRKAASHHAVQGVLMELAHFALTACVELIVDPSSVLGRVNFVAELLLVLPVSKLLPQVFSEPVFNHVSPSAKSFILGALDETNVVNLNSNVLQCRQLFYH